MSHHPRLAYILLAAGESRRFGKPKQLATIDFKKTILQHTLEVTLDFAPGEVELVLGANCEKIKQLCYIETRYPRVNILFNKHWKEGVSSSIACGIHHIMDDEAYDGAIIQLADQVAITASQLKEMRETWYAKPDKIVAAHYNKILGAPAIFPKAYFEKLTQLKGDKGAKWLIEQQQHNTIGFNLETAQWDIDTEQQLNNWQIESL